MKLVVEVLYDGAGAGAYNGKKIFASSIYRTKQEPLTEGGIFVLPESASLVNYVEDPYMEQMDILSSKYGVKQYVFGSFICGRTGEYNEKEFYGNKSKCIEILGLGEEQLVQLAKDFLKETSTHSLLIKVFKTNKLLRICKCFHPVSGEYFNLESIPASVLICGHLEAKAKTTELLVKDRYGKFVQQPIEEKLPIDAIVNEISDTLSLNKDYSFCIRDDKVAVLFPKMSGNYEMMKAYMRQFSYVPTRGEEILSIRGRDWLSVLFRFSDSTCLSGKYRNGDVVLFRSDQPGGHLLDMFGHLSEEDAKKPLPKSEYVGEILDDGSEYNAKRDIAIYSIRTLIPIHGSLSITYEDDIIRLATEEDKKRLEYR